MLCSRKYCESIDVWSLASSYCLMILRKPIFAGNNHPEQIEPIFDCIGTKYLQLTYDIIIKIVTYIIFDCIGTKYFLLITIYIYHMHNCTYNNNGYHHPLNTNFN